MRARSRNTCPSTHDPRGSGSLATSATRPPCRSPCESQPDLATTPKWGHCRPKATNVILASLLTALLTLNADPWADQVIQWTPGTGGAAGYDDPGTTLGPPTRTTVGDLAATPFYPAWGTDELVSIGAGGSITLRFDEPVRDDADNPHGIDLLLFGNCGFVDQSLPQGIVGGLFGADGGELEISVDGIDWIRIPGCQTDGAWPTRGWQDLGPYDAGISTRPTDFTRPMADTLSVDDVFGLPWNELVTYYDGGGGGVGVDLADAGVDAICCVRISNPVGAFFAPELDGVADVSPEHSADVDLNRQVDVSDLLLIIASWNMQDAGREDIDRSGLVDVGDLLLAISQWGQTP